MNSQPPSADQRLAALYYRDFRLFWLAELLTSIGSQMQLIAINWHVFTLLRDQTVRLALFGKEVSLNSDALGLGTLGLVRIIPIVLFALVGGILADSRDRRWVMIWTRAVAVVVALLLAGLTLADAINVPMIYLLTALASALSAFDTPAQQSIMVNLVRREHLTNAISLTNIMYQAGTIAGPALGGFLLAKIEIGDVYLVTVALFLLAMVALWVMRYSGKIEARDSIGLESLKEGVRFTLGTRIILGTMLLDFFATLFASARTMLPLVASDILHVGVAGYGLLATAQPVGALLAAAVLALRRDIRNQGVMLLISVAVYGLATAFFGVATNFALSYFLFALTGASDTVSTVIRGTIRQIMTPDRLRGRMVSVTMIFFMGGPQLGELEAGLVAAAMGVSFAIVSGGLATVLFTACIAWQFPRIRHYTGVVSSADTTA